MSNEFHRTVLEYTDHDGDSITVIYDPLNDDPEDVWVCVRHDGTEDCEPDSRVVVRLPLGLLSQAAKAAGDARLERALDDARAKRVTKVTL
jgi:hypothetical protein